MRKIYEKEEIDYNCPNPIRSYKVRVRIISRKKGKPVDYETET